MMHCIETGLKGAQNMFIVGQSGAGKHLYATQSLINHLADGRSAVIFDCGHSYHETVKALGGTIITVTFAGCQVERFGTLPCVLYDFEKVRTTVSVADLLHLPVPDDQQFILLDEPWFVTSRCPDLQAWLVEAARNKSKFCGVLQTLADFDVEDLPTNVRVLKVNERAVIQADDTLPTA